LSAFGFALLLSNVVKDKPNVAKSKLELALWLSVQYLGALEQFVT